MQNIVITGASGLIATELTFRLLNQSDINLILLSTHPEKLRQRYDGYFNVHCLTLDEFITHYRLGDFKTIIHTAFARSNNGRLLVESVNYTRRLLDFVQECNVHSFINISSQSVYGVSTPPMWREDAPLDPAVGDMYALAKTFTETLVNVMLGGGRVNYTNIRLSSVCENARFLRVFVGKALAGEPIQVQGGEQRFSFIDVRDVVSALVALIEKSDFPFKPIYNLGTGHQTSLIGLAEEVKRVAEERYHTQPVQILRTPSDDHRSVGMDNSRFMADFSWKPALSETDMIISLFEYLTNVNGVGYPIAFKYVYTGI